MGENRHFRIIEKAIKFIKENFDSNLKLAEISEHVGMSDYHFQRLFTKWVGISPKQYSQYLLKERALIELNKEQSLLVSSLALGLSSPSRFHDLVVKTIAMSPFEVRQRGAGVKIQYSFIETPFGQALLAWTTKGIFNLTFTEEKENELNDLKKRWHQATFEEDFINGNKHAQNIFSNAPKEITVLLSGTNFQLKVWEALLETMPSEMITYSDLAAKVGLPKAQRAVGSAVGKNKVAYLIPCHRVIKEDGDIGKYRWGEEKKKNMFVWEKIGNI
jgi:AraC family transcriptional regulator, regulatory protein of adaptative response / methylated-DNA-[protein]-cysteine methyltransferase